MRVMQVVSAAGFNGAIGSAFDQICLLKSRGFDVLPVVIPDSWMSNRLRDEGIDCLESPMSRWPLKEIRRIATVAKVVPETILHTHNSRAHTFGVILRRVFGVPCVASAHQRHIQLHWALNDHVMANSDATRKFHQRFNLVPRSRISTVYCPIRVEKFADPGGERRAALRRELGLNDGDLCLGIIGNIQPRKGHQDLMTAMTSVVRRFPHTRLIVVGDSLGTHGQQIRLQSESLGLSDHVHFVGHRDDVPAIMNLLDLCVVPSREEPFGLTAAESLAAGTPVVAANVGGLPEIVRHGETGLLVPARSPRRLASAICELLESVQMRRDFGAQGRADIAVRFSPERYVDRLAQVYASCLGIPLELPAARAAA